MSETKILGIGLLILSVLFIFLFLFNLFKGLRRFSRLQIGSKILALFLAVFSLTGTISTGYFGVKNLMYKPIEKNNTTVELENTIQEAKNNTDNNTTYKQEVGLDILKGETVDNLYNMYSEKGKSDILAWTNGSEKNKEFLLRNVGRVIDKSKEFEIQSIKDIRGRVLELGSNSNKVLFFGDDTEFTQKQFSTLVNYNKNLLEADRIDFVLIFPTLNGIKVDEYLKKSGLADFKEDPNVYIVTTDSMPNTVNFTLKRMATDYFSVKNLPSFVSIDKNNTISNTGVGIFLESATDVSTYINKSFVDKYKIYNEIVKPIPTKENKVVS